MFITKFLTTNVCHENWLNTQTQVELCNTCFAKAQSMHIATSSFII